MEGPDGLFRHLQSRKAEKAAPIKIDECIYTPLVLPKDPPSQHQPLQISHQAASGSDKGQVYEEAEHIDPVLFDALERFENLRAQRKLAFSGELFFFDYGVVVMWGFTEAEEADILKCLEPFEVNKLRKFKEIERTERLLIIFVMQRATTLKLKSSTFFTLTSTNRAFTTT
jgi:uncharacterized Rmd1/YagE family protein